MTIIKTKLAEGVYEIEIPDNTSLEISEGKLSLRPIMPAHGYSIEVNAMDSEQVTEFLQNMFGAILPSDDDEEPDQKEKVN